MQLYKISHSHAKFLYNYSYLWIREKKIRFRTSLVLGSPLYSFVVAFSRFAKTHVGQLQRDMLPKMCDVIYEWTFCAVIIWHLRSQ